MSTELAEKLEVNDPVMAPGSVQLHEDAEAPPSSPFSPRGKLRLVTRAALDQRTTAARLFDKLVTDISADLGGMENLSQIERSLIEAYAGASLMLNHLSAKLIEGEPISLQRYATACGALVRIATRLGIKRRAPQDETPALDDYLRAKAEPAAGGDGGDQI